MRSAIHKCITLIAVLPCLWGCYDIVNNYFLEITNKLDRNLAILYSNDPSLNPNGNNIAYYTADENIIEPDSNKVITKNGGKNAWHDYIEQGKTKRLYFYIFETDTLKKYDTGYSMADLVRAHKYYKLIHYSEDELKKIDWKVTVNK